MNTIKDIKALNIISRRWFDGDNTITSCLVEIAYKDGQTESLHAVETGYGDYYNQMALELMREKFSFNVPVYPNGQKVYSTLTRWADENGITCFYSVTDVTRKKDL